MSGPLRIAFLGCGFISRVHSRILRSFGSAVSLAYASRDRARADAFCRELGGARSFGDYTSAIEDRAIDAVVVAVPPRYHLDLVRQALAAGKHVLVEKPALVSSSDYATAIVARDRAQRVVMVGENDHYKPLVVTLRRLLAADAIGELVLAHFITVANRQKTADDWRNDEWMAGGDAFFEEGIHWLHLAGCLGPRIATVTGFRPPASTGGPDRRAKSLLAAFQYDTGAAGAIYYSREVPSLLLGLRFSKLFGRRGVITFESNGGLVLTSGRGLPRGMLPGWWYDIRGYRAMYRDFLASIRERRQPEMSLERALEDQRLMEMIYSGSTSSTGSEGSAGSRSKSSPVPGPGAGGLEPTRSPGPSDAH